MKRNNIHWRIFRHGLTYYSKFGIPYGANQKTAEVLDEGYPPIERLGKYLGETSHNKEEIKFYSSPYLRCRQTSEVVCKKTSVTPIYDNRLGEFEEGREGIQEFKERIADFTKSVEAPTIWVCTHGACLAFLKHLLTEGEVSPSDLFDYPNSGVLWDIRNEEFTHTAF